MSDCMSRFVLPQADRLETIIVARISVIILLIVVAIMQSS